MGDSVANRPGAVTRESVGRTTERTLHDIRQPIAGVTGVTPGGAAVCCDTKLEDQVLGSFKIVMPPATRNRSLNPGPLRAGTPTVRYQRTARSRKPDLPPCPLPDLKAVLNRRRSKVTYLLACEELFDPDGMRLLKRSDGIIIDLDLRPSGISDMEGINKWIRWTCDEHKQVLVVGRSAALEEWRDLRKFDVTMIEKVDEFANLDPLHLAEAISDKVQATIPPRKRGQVETPPPPLPPAGVPDKSFYEKKTTPEDLARLNDYLAESDRYHH